MYKYQKLYAIFLFSFLLTSFFTYSFASSYTKYVWTPIDNSITTASSLKSDTINHEDNFLNLESGSAILVEQKTGKILYSHNIHEKLHPASITKIMSILLIMKQLESGKLQLTDQIPCSEKAAKMGRFTNMA